MARRHVLAALLAVCVVHTQTADAALVTAARVNGAIFTSMASLVAMTGIGTYMGVEQAKLKDDINTNEENFSKQIEAVEEIVNATSGEVFLRFKNKAGDEVLLTSNVRGQSGLGSACWDLDGDSVCTTATEDINKDGECTVADCLGGIRPDYYQSTLVADVVGATAPTDLVFSTVSASSVLNGAISTASGMFTLQAGNTYRIRAEVAVSVGEALYTIYDVSSAASLGQQGSSISNYDGASGLSSGVHHSTVAEAIVTPTAAKTVSVRITEVADTPTISSAHSRVWVEQLTNVPVNAFNGATALVAGTIGHVPQPAAGDHVNFLRGDGTWAAASATLITDGSGTPTSIDTAGTQLTFRVNNVNRMDVTTNEGAIFRNIDAVAGNGGSARWLAASGGYVQFKADNTMLAAEQTVYNLPTGYPTGTIPMFLTSTVGGDMSWSSVTRLSDTDGDTEVDLYSADDVLKIKVSGATMAQMDGATTPNKAIWSFPAVDTWSEIGASRSAAYTTRILHRSPRNEFGDNTANPTVAGAVKLLTDSATSTTNGFVISAPTGMSTNMGVTLPSTMPTASQVLTAAAPVGGTVALSWTDKACGLTYETTPVAVNGAYTPGPETGPGGQAVYRWLRADKEVYNSNDTTVAAVHGDSVRHWADANASSEFLESYGTSSPTYQAASYKAGYSDAIQFGTDTELKADTWTFFLPAASSDFTVFSYQYWDNGAVGTQQRTWSVGNGINGSMSLLWESSSGVLRFHDGDTDLPVLDFPAEQARVTDNIGNAINRYGSVAGIVWDLNGFTGSADVQTGMFGAANRTLEAATIEHPDWGSSTDPDDRFTVGGHAIGVTVSEFHGVVGEFISLDSVATATQRQRISSYLGLKYGTPFVPDSGAENDYLLSDGTQIWNGTADSAYNKDVFGLVRDDASGLHHNKAGHTTGDFPVLVQYGSGNAGTPGTAHNLATDKMAIMFGRLDSYQADFPYLKEDGWKTSTSWLVRTTNAAGTHVVSFGAQKEAAPAYWSMDTVMVADDAAFTTNVKYYQMTKTGTYNTAVIEVSSGKYVRMGRHAVAGTAVRYHLSPVIAEIAAANTTAMQTQSSWSIDMAECGSIVAIYSAQRPDRSQWIRVNTDVSAADNSDSWIVYTRQNDVSMPGMGGTWYIASTRDNMDGDSHDDRIFVHCTL